MKTLVLGYSSIFQRRVLPALESLGIRDIDVATRTRSVEARESTRMGGRVYDDYSEALEQSDAELVYVSCANAHHARWVEAALRCDRHVVVDKPAFTEWGDAQRLLALSEERGRCLAEATVYGAHPRIVRVSKIFAEAADAPLRISASFSFPPLAEENFRHHRELGGGAIFDLGPYAVSVGRLFFGAEPEELICRVTGRAGEVEVSFSVLATYPGARAMVGHFGFGTRYRNHLEVLGARVGVSLDRVFTTPPDLESRLEIQVDGEARSETVAPSDAFANFFASVYAAIESRTDAPLRAALRMDAGAIARLRADAGIGALDARKDAQ